MVSRSRMNGSCINFYYRFGRGQFIETSKIALLNNTSANSDSSLRPAWDTMRCLAFDCPITRSTVRTRSAHCEYETRYQELLDVKVDHPVVISFLSLSQPVSSHSNLSSLMHGKL